MLILAGDVDKIFVPFDRGSSFSQSQPAVKVEQSGSDDFDSGVQSTDFSRAFVQQERTQLKLVL
jgi:hypothetical protein